MRYMNIMKCEATNYVGIGISIFFSGCNFRCKGCHNFEAWDFNSGEEFSKEIEDQFITEAKKPYIKRIVILGGEPLHQDLKQMKDFILRLKTETGKKIVMFTGYTYEELQQMPERFAIIKECDVLIDGRFKKDLYSPKFRFFGSSNQRIIDIKKTLENNEVVLVDIKTEID